MNGSKSYSSLYIILGIFPFLTAICLMYLPQLFLITVVVIRAANKGLSDPAEVNADAYEFLYAHLPIGFAVYGVILTAVFLIWNRYAFGEGLRVFLPDRSSINIRNAIAVILIAVAANYIAYATLYFYKAFTPSLFEDYLTLTGRARGGGSIIYIVYSILLAPIAEELAFRNLSFRYLSKSVLPVWAVIVIQAFLFGLLHMNFIQTAYTFVFGILLGLIRYKTGKLFFPLMTHFFFNLWGILSRKLVDFDKMTQNILIAVISVFVVALCYLFLLNGSVKAEES